MRRTKTVSFSDEKLFKEIGSYAMGRHITFSRGLLELATVGLTFRYSFGHLKVELVKQKLEDLETLKDAYKNAAEILRSRSEPKEGK